MKLLYGTGNPAKLEAMRRRLSVLGIEILGLNDIQMEVPKIIEDGNTPLENARKKAIEYYRAFHMPVFSCDSGLYMDNIPENLQGGRRYSDAEDACDNLYSAIDSIEDAISDVNSMDEYISKAISYLNTASM